MRSCELRYPFGRAGGVSFCAGARGGSHRCTKTEQHTTARDAGAAVGIGVQAIRCGTFLHRSYNWTKGKSKNRRFLAAFFSIFLSLLKEIWPPEAEKQDAGATRNRRTENGPSGTPAPTEDQTRVHRYSKVRRCGYDNGARHHQCGTRERQRCQFKDSWRDLRAPPHGTRERQRG